MASITFQYRSIKDQAPLEARLTYKLNGKHTSLYVGSRITTSKIFWKEYQKGINFRDGDKANLKKDIDKQCDELKTFILDQFYKSFPSDLSNVSKEWLSDTVYRFYNPVASDATEIVPTSLVEYWDYYLKSREYEFEGKLPSYRKWITVRNKVINLQESTDKEYDIKDVNESFLKEFIRFSKRENYSNYTTQKEFSYIKTVCTHARTKGIEVSPELDVLRVKLRKKPTAKIYLTFDELDTLAALQGLPDYLDNARDWLIISCYTGQRISDFMRFDKSMIRNDRGKMFLDVKQQKTGKSVSIPVLPEVIRILDKREGDFPRAISHQRYNDYIKEVCRLAGLTEVVSGGKRIDKRKVSGEYPKYELITSHVGRRSFATNYYGKLPTSFLKDISGHGTEAQLNHYLGRSPKDTAFEAYDLLINARNQ